MTDEDKLFQILARLKANPILAHDVVFARRHPNKTPEFHHEMIRDLWSDEEYVGTEAFREGAKSTLHEEGIALMALFAIEPFFLIIGANYDRAVDRLGAIKHEFETNEVIAELFGDVRGPVWNDGEVVLKNGVKIMALGARMKFRGVKYNDARPKFVLIDDLEDEENTNTAEKRERLSRWVSRVVFPACRWARKRIVGTPLDPRSWLETMRKSAKWRFRVYPIVIPATTNPDEWERSQWPDRYPLAMIRNIRDDMERQGDLQGFVQEYLCKSEDPALKPFKESHYIQGPPLPAYAPSYVICDPARSVGTKAARTGYEVHSWIGSKLYIRHAFGSYDMPSAIVDTLFKLDAAFQPIAIGVEKDGLEQWLMQPIRQEMIKRGVVLPLMPLMAPRDRNKENFIRGLQPFFNAGEVLMCGDFPDLKGELLNFPTGLKDILNAIAYAPRMRPGKPVYEDFGLMHVRPDLRPHPGPMPLHLVFNAEMSHTTGVLVQHVNNRFRVLADFVIEGGVQDALEQIVPMAIQLAGAKPIKLFAPAEQFDQYNNFGLPQAAARLKLGEIVRGPQYAKSLGVLTKPLREQNHLEPAFLVNATARWTINAMAAGYAYELEKSGILSDHPQSGYYATLMRGLESFAAWLTQGTAYAGANVPVLETAPDGREFISARAGAHHRGEAVQLKRG